MRTDNCTSYRDDDDENREDHDDDGDYSEFWEENYKENEAAKDEGENNEPDATPRRADEVGFTQVLDESRVDAVPSVVSTGSTDFEGRLEYDDDKTKFANEDEIRDVCRKVHFPPESDENSADAPEKCLSTSESDDDTDEVCKECDVLAPERNGYADDVNRKCVETSDCGDDFDDVLGKCLPTSESDDNTDVDDVYRKCLATLGSDDECTDIDDIKEDRSSVILENDEEQTSKQPSNTSDSQDNENVSSSKSDEEIAPNNEETCDDGERDRAEVRRFLFFNK